MTFEEKYKILSNDFMDTFIEYNGNENILNNLKNVTTHIINPKYAIGYVEKNTLMSTFTTQFGTMFLPRCYGLTSEISLEASGIQKLRNLPGYNLKGKGVLVAIIDTGIDYTNPIFIREDGTSKIVGIWDQTIESDSSYPSLTFFGTEYSAEQINQALQSSNPLEIVPSYDENGHGTMLAGVIAGSEVSNSNFVGVAPDVSLVIVKLKQAKQNIKDFYLIPPNVPCYQENDILWSIQYIEYFREKINLPTVICIGLGSSQGSHDGKGPLDDILSIYGRSPSFGVAISAGNEGNKKRHFYSKIDASVGVSSFELNIAENEPGFSLEIWGELPNTYSIDILSPSGEYIPRISESLQKSQEIGFIFSKTKIFVNYRLVEVATGEQLILLRFHNPSEGIWRIQVYSRGDLPGNYHVWLPSDGFLSDQTYFLTSDRFTTVTSPGNAPSPITVTAYDPINGTLYSESSRGYSRINIVKPDLAAPGVNIVVPNLAKGFSVASGTGLAVAHTAGILAILMEWGIVNGFYPNMNTIVMKKYLIRGAQRSSYLQYPNQDWGYGKIDLYNVFNVLRVSFPR